MTPQETWNSLLAAILKDFGCQTGTIHRSDDGKLLSLVCQIGVPDSLLDRIATVPFGKGIAGAAAGRGEPVELCNLQFDLGGVAQPSARQTGVSGSLAVPVFSKSDGRVIGTLGIGKFAPHDFTDGEKQRLAGHAEQIAGHFEDKEG